MPTHAPRVIAVVPPQVLDGASAARNVAQGDGGAVCALQGNEARLTLAGGGAMTDNAAVQGSGGAMFAGGRLQAWLSSSASLSLNSADSGGALYCAGSIGTVLVSGGSAFAGNTARAQGGAMYAAVSIDNVTLSDGGALVGNRATYGGGLAVPSGRLGTMVLLRGSLVSGNRALIDGGGLYAGNIGEVMAAGGSTMSDNVAETGTGGAVAATGTIGRLSLLSGDSPNERHNSRACRKGQWRGRGCLHDTTSIYRGLHVSGTTWPYRALSCAYLVVPLHSCLLTSGCLQGGGGMPCARSVVRCTTMLVASIDGNAAT